jgi:acyl-CoA dehydrogenase
MLLELARVFLMKGGGMYDFLLTPEEQALKKEVRQFVREEISSDFLRQMDNDEITYPREFVEKLAARGLRGIRFPKQYGGRGMSWVADVAATEEIGCLGMALGCAFVMPSIVGEALEHVRHRSAEAEIPEAPISKANWWRPRP